MRTLFKALFLLGAISMLTACDKDDDPDVYLLTGKWQSGTLFEKYHSNGDGYTWDLSEDVQENEAQRFTWELTKNELTQLHIMEIGGVVPRFYTITELSETRLKYEGHGRKYSFTRVKE